MLRNRFPESPPVNPFLASTISLLLKKEARKIVKNVLRKVVAQQSALALEAGSA